jgi:hypothetical protein
MLILFRNGFVQPLSAATERHDARVRLHWSTKASRKLQLRKLGGGLFDRHVSFAGVLLDGR